MSRHLRVNRRKHGCCGDNFQVT